MGRYDGLSQSEARQRYKEETEENQRQWTQANKRKDEGGMAAAHQKQVEVQKDWDALTGGTSRYDSRTGVWYSSDGTDTSGAPGVSMTQPYYNRKTSASYGDYRREFDDYRGASFSYDPQKDSSYQAYQKQYTRAAKQAMDDTISRVSARTGGLASSYAVSAGAAAYNNQMDALTDRIPELEQIAYSRFMDDQNRRLRAMQVAEAEMDKEERTWEKNRAAYEKEQDASAAYQATLQKYQQRGWDALSDTEKTMIYRKGGYYDAQGKAIVDGSGKAYASAYDPLWNALYAFQSGGRGALSAEDTKVLADAGYRYDGKNDWVIDPSGNAFGRDPASMKNENAAASVAWMKYQNGIRLSEAEMKLLAGSMSEAEIAEMVRKNQRR